MKKALSIVASCAILSLTALASIQWDSLDNLAKGATVTVSSNPGAANVITDGNDGSRWQATPGTHNNTHDWVLIDLGSPKQFNDIEIKWEASHCRAYSIYLPETADFYTAEADYNAIPEEWFASHSPISTGTDDTEANYTSNNSFATVTSQYILIYADEYNNFGSNYGMSIYEVRVGYVANANAVTSLSVSSAGAAVGAEATVTVTGLNAVGNEVGLDGVTNLKLTAGDPAVTISGGENGVFTVSASAWGNYTLTATATVDGETVTGSGVFAVEFDWTGIKNEAVGKKIIGRYIPGVDNPNPAENAVDGDSETYYEYNGAWAGGNSWVMVDLGSEYFIEAIGASYAQGGGRVALGYSLDDSGLQSYVADNSQWIWNNSNVPEGWTFRSLDRASNSTVTVTYAEPVKARYIAVRDTDNPNGKPQLREVLVKGEQIQASVASDMEISFEKGGLFVGETSTVSVTILDQYGQPFGSADDAVITVEGADYANGVITATTPGKITVTAKAGDTVKTAYLMVADKADYCMDGATVTSDEAKSAPSAAIDGGADPQNHGEVYVVTENESKGEHTHWILADLHKEYELDMIIAIWEGACPADYDVYVGATEDSLEKLYSIRGHNQNTWYDRFSGKEMKGVRFIKLVTTSNATGYGIKLFDLKAYGKSNVVSTPTEITITVSGNNISTDESVNVDASVLDQFEGKISDAEIEYTCIPATASVVNNKFKAEQVGSYVIKAVSGNLEASTIVNVVADAANKVAEAKSVSLNGEAREQNPFNNQEIVITELPSTLEIELDGNYNLDLIKLRWEAACPSDYTVVATYADGSSATILRMEGRGFKTGFNPIDRIYGSAPAAAISLAAEDNSSLGGVNKLTIIPTAKDHDYNLRLFGVDAYGTKDVGTSITGLMSEGNGLVNVYNLQGVCVRRNVPAADATRGLPTGLYIAGGKKIFVK